VAGISASTANQSSAAAAPSPTATPTGSTPSRIYPTDNYQATLYPLPAPTQQPDRPQPVRFSNVDQILVRARSTAQIPDAMDQITALLRQRHRLGDGEVDDFNIRDMAETSKALASTAQLMSGLLLCVAAISLVVGGVGIMNIMLVSVTERTREIGLRMAVGARARDILRQFLGEAIVLCLLGGILGILVGRASSYAVRTLLNWPTELSLPAIVAAVVVAVGTGLIFGYYPAWKAAHLDPIEALRYE
jgi:ABC-type antimicrobial peptide transport system permease subunit